MLTIHITKGISETPDEAKAVFAELSNVSPSLSGELVPVVEGMSPEGQQRAIVHIAGFLKARASYQATIKRLGLDDGPDAA
jgi:hypothetical protein